MRTRRRFRRLRPRLRSCARKFREEGNIFFPSQKKNRNRDCVNVFCSLFEHNFVDYGDSKGKVDLEISFNAISLTF